MNWLQQLLLPLLLTTGESVLLDFGKKQLAENPIFAKGAIATIYVWVDGAVEEYVKKTPATWDDDAVNRVKRVCEKLAIEAKFTLPNIDAGQPND